MTDQELRKYCVERAIDINNRGSNQNYTNIGVNYYPNNSWTVIENTAEQIYKYIKGKKK